MLNYFVLVMAAGHLLKEILSLFSQVRRSSPRYIAYYNLQGNNYNMAEIFEFLSLFTTLEKRGKLVLKCARNCFWDCYWGRAGQLLVNFFPCPWLQSHKSLRNLTRSSFFLTSKVPNCVRDDITRLASIH